mmetsp:Transcript_31409/g.91744  ORF Transcript_31409/g.91744 Transcript_31409/m.91744 type:complete len:216 (-) Transcript_31409:570-1217(-)
MLDEAPELRQAPMIELTGNGVHRVLLPVHELEFDTENDPQEPERISPKAKIVFRFQNAHASVEAHDPHPCGVAMQETTGITATMNAVRDDSAQRKEVTGSLDRQKVPQWPDPLIQVCERPTGIHGDALAPIRHAVEAELPVSRRSIVAQRNNEHVGVRAVGYKPPSGMPCSGDPHFVTFRMRICQSAPQGLVVPWHDPRGATIHMISPIAECAPS